MKWTVHHRPYIESETAEGFVIKCHDCSRHVVLPRDGIPMVLDHGDQAYSHSFSTVPWFNVSAEKG